MSTITAVRIPAEGLLITTAEIDNGLESLQSEVHGYIEALDLSDDLTMWVNEEGKVDGLPMNVGATIIAGLAGALQPGDYIAGDVVLTGGVDAEGETLSIPSELAADLVALDAEFAGSEK